MRASPVAGVRLHRIPTCRLNSCAGSLTGLLCEYRGVLLPHFRGESGLSDPEILTGRHIA